jgi:hypothetical protein
VKRTSSVGFTLLSIWLIVMGLSQAIALSFAFMPMLLGVLAIAAGVMILLGR